MSDIIKMSPTEMEEHARSYKKVADEMNSLLKKMDKIKTQISSTMESKTVKSFGTTYDRLKPSFEEMRDLVERISKALTNTAKNMREQDNQNAGQFK